MTLPYPTEPAGSSDPVDTAPTTTYLQLTQVRVELGDVVEAFSVPDDQGRYPIVVLVRPSSRIPLTWLIAAIGLAVAAVALPLGPVLTIAGIVLAIAILVGSLYRSVRTLIPEGTIAVLTRAGRLLRLAPAGIHRLPPTVAVSHVVAIRELPFSAVARAVPTSDDVRIDVQILVSLRIEDPAKFVFNTTAVDFDAVCQAASQTALRLAIRKVDSEHVMNLAATESDALREEIGSHLAAYGAIVTAALIVRVDPPADFLTILEARRLTVLRTFEAEQRFGLDTTIQKEQATLALQETQSRMARELEEAELAAKVRRLETEAESEREALRLARLQERLAAYPAAASWDWESEKLQVARSLAGNTRAMLQLGGGAGGIADALVRRALLDDSEGNGSTPDPAPEPSDATNGSGTAAQGARRGRSVPPKG